MKIIIIGASQLGYFLTKNLLEEGHDIRLIDNDRSRCEMIANAFDVSVFCGDGTEIEILAAAGAGKSDVMIAVTDRDEDNLIACEIGKKQFGVKRTISKSNSHKNIRLMKRLGVDVVLDTTNIITELIEHEIDGAPVKLLADISTSNAMISEFNIPLEWKDSGKRVMELEIPEDCVLVYIKRNDMLMIPRGNTMIMAGDEVVALTIGHSVRKLKKVFGL